LTLKHKQSGIVPPPLPRVKKVPAPEGMRCGGRRRAPGGHITYNALIVLHLHYMAVLCIATQRDEKGGPKAAPSPALG
jgi:hypothetical protein